MSALYKFTRPHTMMGTFLSVCSVSVLAMHGQPWDLHCWTALCAALAAALLANVSIVGLNQCFDVELDRVNKPYLPLASGEWTMQTGWTTVLVTGARNLRAFRHDSARPARKRGRSLRQCPCAHEELCYMLLWLWW